MATSTTTATTSQPQPQQTLPPKRSDRPLLVTFMLRGYVDPELKRLRRGAIQEVATKLGLKYKAVEYVWLKFKDSILEPEAHPLPNFTRKKASGRPVKISPDEMRRRVMEVPLSERKGRGYRFLAAKTGIHHSVLHRAVKRGTLKL